MIFATICKHFQLQYFEAKNQIQYYWISTKHPLFYSKLTKIAEDEALRPNGTYSSSDVQEYLLLFFVKDEIGEKFLDS